MASTAPVRPVRPERLSSFSQPLRRVSQIILGLDYWEWRYAQRCGVVDIDLASVGVLGWKISDNAGSCQGGRRDSAKADPESCAVVGWAGSRHPQVGCPARRCRGRAAVLRRVCSALLKLPASIPALPTPWRHDGFLFPSFAEQDDTTTTHASHIIQRPRRRMPRQPRIYGWATMVRDAPWHPTLRGRTARQW